MKLYIQSDKTMTWREIEDIPGAVVVCVPCTGEGTICHGKHVPLPVDTMTQYMSMPRVFIPAPDAERAVASWQKVIDALWLMNRDVYELRQLAQYLRSKSLHECTQAAMVFDAIADALEEAEGE